MTIQQRISPSNPPRFFFNIPVTSCLSIYNGIQFKFGAVRGYIDLILKDDNTGPLKETTINLEFQYDKEYNGYWLHMGETTLIFYGDNLTDILDNIQSETREYHKEEQTKLRERMEANSSIPKEIWDSIDNMMEK
jgi:hypothetical protein